MRSWMLVLLVGCGGVETPDEPNENEVITTVMLTFAGPSVVEAKWVDLGDGPVVDPIALENGAVYDLSVRFLNELETPPEEITDEVAAEAEEHQVFFTGADALLDIAYADADSNGFDVGLSGSVTVLGAGTDELTVTLRHLPEESGAATKTGDLAATVATDGFGAIPGETDVQVTFQVEAP